MAMYSLLCLYALIVFATSYYELYYCMFFYGLILSVIIVSAILLTLQMTTRDRWAFAILVILIAIAGIDFYIELFFLFISKNWKVLFEIIAVGTLLVIIFVHF